MPVQLAPLARLRLSRHGGLPVPGCSSHHGTPKVTAIHSSRVRHPCRGSALSMVGHAAALPPLPPPLPPSALSCSARKRRYCLHRGCDSHPECRAARPALRSPDLGPDLGPEMGALPNPAHGRLLALLVDAGTSRRSAGWVQARTDKLQAARELLEPLSLEQRLPLFEYKASQHMGPAEGRGGPPCRACRPAPPAVACFIPARSSLARPSGRVPHQRLRRHCAAHGRLEGVARHGAAAGRPGLPPGHGHVGQRLRDRHARGGGRGESRARRRRAGGHAGAGGRGSCRPPASGPHRRSRRRPEAAAALGGRVGGWQHGGDAVPAG